MSKINCDLINVSICLTDLDPAQFKVLDNGKKYLNCSIRTRREPDKFGNDLVISYKKRETETETKYVNGSAKSVTFQQDAPVTEYVRPNDDKLPF